MSSGIRVVTWVVENFFLHQDTRLSWFIFLYAIKARFSVIVVQSGFSSKIMRLGFVLSRDFLKEPYIVRQELSSSREFLKDFSLTFSSGHVCDLNSKS